MRFLPTSVMENVPRIIVLIDLPDLRWQLRRIGGSCEDDLSRVLKRLEAGLAGLQGRTQEQLFLAGVCVYAPAETYRETDGVVFKPRGNGIKRDCSACYRACTHCKGGERERGGHGLDNPLAGDLLELAGQDQYDWAVIVTLDLLLVPVVRYLQSHDRKIIHGCFPPLAGELTKQCWASIDLGRLFKDPNVI